MTIAQMQLVIYVAHLLFIYMFFLIMYCLYSEKNVNHEGQNSELSKEAKVAMENMISKSNVASNNENIA